MGWDIEFFNDDGEYYHVNLRILNLTYNYSRPECKKYWYGPRDYDGKTIGEAIAIMEKAVSTMIDDGIEVVSDLLYNFRMGIKMDNQTELLGWLISNYSDLIKAPRNLRIKLS
jgi:hypothetical protein